MWTAATVKPIRREVYHTESAKAVWTVIITMKNRVPCTLPISVRMVGIVFIFSYDLILNVYNYFIVS